MSAEFDISNAPAALPFSNGTAKHAFRARNVIASLPFVTGTAAAPAALFV
jgi:hypothetical protein